ncbi:Eco57I restriction-modification methylase domain-containing protein [Deinococcus peraridilitoris]|uniref:site-specific DNA-methyltransferase (adenine-specific) n=1 Tax=Deinococcus peraridilitoris (strain DSM 19664 / LMG 22246 / CIP 109416 / KR-200) TaxID=937777 RepID=L0A010_DEIPD|nr:type IIL restriction-modification enzyme MmeI [Deinococcus peraridilitoris]AFZ67166.1 hypothetical protein Deipe_1631 [Deinococcus peraridilitoris DSM 19664]
MRLFSETDSTLDWLSLVDVAGAWFAPDVLGAEFQQGLDTLDPGTRRRVHEAWREWREAVVDEDPLLAGLHREWVKIVLDEVLSYGPPLLTPVDPEGNTFVHVVPESGEALRPTFVVGRADNAPKLLVVVHDPNTPLDKPLARARGTSSPLERTVTLCRGLGVRSAIVTNGERWAFVDAPLGSVSGHVSWYARYWWQEAVTLRAFHSLLNARRLFGRDEGTPWALLDRSAEYREEVTSTLGQQVERAVEVLVHSIDRANRDKGDALLHDVSPTELYEAGLTVMMRLVVLLCAEERGLLLLGDPTWDESYAVSTLRGQLDEAADRDGPAVLERRHDAWSRLLATFRAVYGGVEHESLRLPALGGSLFDPDRFPFLEGRTKDTSWRDKGAEPLPIDNRTVLLLLSALQKLERGDGAQVLSYRALDVEQIGHVYEGLLERTVTRLPEPTLGLEGSAKFRNPSVKLAELESAQLDGTAKLVDFLVKKTGRAKPGLTKALAKEVGDTDRARLLQACEGDRALLERVLPFARLLRLDAWGEPIVYPAGAFAVTSGDERGTTGAHYTPKALTERVVATTLTPLAYHGPAQGLPREDWRLKTPGELLDLKVCDPAMGSGAFLVQVCRWLGDRVVESWANAEAGGKVVDAFGEVRETSEGVEPLSNDAEERLLLARRLVAERCVYGVDINPFAVELAKLSLWLVTLAKGRPFGFLDHNLRHGDSLLGLHALRQLTELAMTPTGKQLLFAGDVERAVKAAVSARSRLRDTPILDIQDVEKMAKLDAEARSVLERPHLAADAMIGEALRHAAAPQRLEPALIVLANEVGGMLKGDHAGEAAVAARARAALSTDVPTRKRRHRPFHWPLEFPEVFVRGNAGFDAFVGNPPFLGGQKITSAMGAAFRDYLVSFHADGNKGSADLVAYFFLSCHDLLREAGYLGLIAVNTIAEGATREIGLARLTSEEAVIFEAHPNESWPGKAAVVTSRVHITKGDWGGKKILLDRDVQLISAFLTDQADKKALPLKSNEGKSFQGSITLGQGFVLEPHVASRLLETAENREVLFPYLIGDDLTTHPQQHASRWVINFWDWPLSRGAEGVWVSADEVQRRNWLKVGTVPSDFPGHAAEDYPSVLTIVERDVKPDRQRKDENGRFLQREARALRWWQHAEKATGLYHSIGRGANFWSHPRDWSQQKPAPAEVICFATGATKYPSFEFCSNYQVFANTLGIITLFDNDSYAILNSSIHGVWAWKYGSRMKRDLRYTPTDCFETFPFPSKDNELHALGAALRAARKRGHASFDVGLTDLYNMFHDPEVEDEAILELRRVHRLVDERLAALYGFDFDLEHGFHDVPFLPPEDRRRFTVSEAARLEVLRRLADLNQERYDEEQAEAEIPVKPTKPGTRVSKGTSTDRQPSLLDSAPTKRSDSA